MTIARAITAAALAPALGLAVFVRAVAARGAVRGAAVVQAVAVRAAVSLGVLGLVGSAGASGTPAAASFAEGSSSPPRGSATSSTPRPQRIVSLNLCADQLVVSLADRAQIAAITWLARDRAASAIADQAGTLPITYGSAEEITRLRPDLVIAGRYTTRTTVALLRRFGYRLVEIDIASSFAQIEAQIQQIADLVGAPARGARMIADMRARLARVETEIGHHSAPEPVAAVFAANGITQGTGTLADAVLRASGLRNMAAEAGVRGAGSLSLEGLLRGRPDVVVLPDLTDVGAIVGQDVLAHPALAGRTLSPGSGSPGHREWAAHVVRMPSKWTTCGGPWTVTAVEHLRRVTR